MITETSIDFRFSFRNVLSSVPTTSTHTDQFNTSFQVNQFPSDLRVLKVFYQIFFGFFESISQASRV